MSNTTPARRGLASAMSLVATLAVLDWAWRGDLRLYAAVQFLPMLLVPGVWLLRLPPTAPGTVGGRDWAIVFALYGLAKLAEAFDAPLHAALGGLSGHTLKHLLAAAGAAWLLRAVVRGASQLR